LTLTSDYGFRWPLREGRPIRACRNHRDKHSRSLGLFWVELEMSMTADSRKTPSLVELHKSSIVVNSSPRPDRATNGDRREEQASLEGNLNSIALCCLH